MPDTDLMLRAARATIGQVQYCFAITVGQDGAANARIIEPFPLEDDWSVTFVTSRSSRKTAEIEQTGRLTLGYQHDPEGAYVTLVGRARIDPDPNAVHGVWRDSLNLWFPDGPNDPDAVVIRFETERVELWNFAQEIMPEPKGLRAAVLDRRGADWICVQG